MTYIPRRDITNLIPNKFEAIRVLALECRRLNDEIRAREDGEIEGKLTTLAVKQMLEGKVTYYDAKERREQERSEAMLSAAEGLLDIAEPMLEGNMVVRFHWKEPDLHEFGWLGVSLAQLDAGGEIDISDFVRDAVGGVELADVVQSGCGTTGFFL